MKVHFLFYIIIIMIGKPAKEFFFQWTYPPPLLELSGHIFLELQNKLFFISGQALTPLLLVAN